MQVHIKVAPSDFFFPTQTKFKVYSQTAVALIQTTKLINSCKGYKAALSVSVFHTMGNICCMEDTMGLGKFFTSTVTA